MDDRRESTARRFVLLRHELPSGLERGSHWDLMLEFHGILLTWELPTLEFNALPATFETLGIRRLADHRLAYLEYEGPVSGDRGFVQRTDSGVYRFGAAKSNAQQSPHTEVHLLGDRYRIGLELPAAVWQGPKQIERVGGSQAEGCADGSGEPSYVIEPYYVGAPCGDGRLMYFELKSFVR